MLPSTTSFRQVFSSASAGSVSLAEPGIDVEGKPSDTTWTQVEPKHYKFEINGQTFDILDVIQALGLNFALGNVLKYVARAGKKSDTPVVDLKKAKQYLERELKRHEP